MKKSVKNNEKENDTDDGLDLMSEAEAAYGLSEWFGAVFYYLINLGKKPFHEMHQKKYRSRNVWTGWILQIAVVAGLIFAVWKLTGDTMD